MRGAAASAVITALQAYAAQTVPVAALRCLGWSICLFFGGGDLNGDCYVNFLDFAIFANRWLNEVVLSAENLDRTGKIDLNDLAIFVENWLWQEQ